MKFTSLSLVALCLLVACEATPVTFRVVAPGSTASPQVSISGQVTTLTAADPAVPYYTGQAELPAGATYKYVVNGQAEAFDRTLDATRTTTRNDFYNRAVTYANLPKFPSPIATGGWTRGGDYQEMWDDNYIPSIFMTGAAADMETLITTVPSTTYKTDFTFIGPETVSVFKGCDFGIHGAGKKNNNAKQSWAWALPANQTLSNRNWFKIRHMEEDPTQMREKLYADILHSLGSYGNRANMVRLFINSEGFGTFNMLDDVVQYSYINAMFYNGAPPSQMGPLYDGASGASFAYSDNDDSYSAFQPNKASPQSYTAIKPLALAFSQVNIQDNASLANFAKMFDVDQFLRFMVVEYLTADWDGYWQGQTNDGAYQDPVDSKWYYLGQDFDATFGVNLAVPQGKEFVKVSYTQWPQQFPNGILINKLLQNPDTKTTFESYLKNTVTQLFNNVTLTNRVLAYHDFILPDLQWDRTIKQRSPGINFGWTIDQVTANLYAGVSAPNANGGGADWGLIEWIAAMGQSVATEFNLQIPATPVLGTSGNTTTSGTAGSASASASSGAAIHSAASSVQGTTSASAKSSASSMSPSSSAGLLLVGGAVLSSVL